MKHPITIETAFGSYVLTEVIGEGGAGRVYGATGPDQTLVAVKVLSQSQATSDRRKRFKNEIAFLLRNKHPNIVSVIDHGVAADKTISGSFYVMRKYDTNLRTLMNGKIQPGNALSIFARVLDGVEAAHLLGAVHRDLKPENVLWDVRAGSPAIADFGIASFTDDLVATDVNTRPTQRLANFQYAAPEQRVPGRTVGVQADIYALGLVLNELFTGKVPHGTEYQRIEDVHKDYAYLDLVVDRMLRQNPADRFNSIADLKGAIARHHEEFLTAQRLDEISATVVPEGEITDPLAFTPPKIANVSWNNGQLTITLDREVHDKWVNALRNMGSFTSVWGIEPGKFTFKGTQARVAAREEDAQNVINYFKQWLPVATQVLRSNLKRDIECQKSERQAQLRREREVEEQRLRVNKNLTF